MSVITSTDLNTLLTKARAILNGVDVTAEQVAFVSAVFETVRRVEDQTTIQSLTQRIQELESQSTEAFQVGDVKYSIQQNDHNGWLLMNGRNLSRFTYALLFATHSSFAATGNQIDTFDLPDWRGRTLIGAGQGLGLTLRNLLELGGAENHTLSAVEVGEHDHLLLASGTRENISASTYVKQSNGVGEGGLINENFEYQLQGVTTNPPSLGKSGKNVGNQPHNNMQPFAACNVFIYSGVI